MAIVFAVTSLFDKVKARFDLESPGVVIEFGWRAVSTQKEPGRSIVCMPGDTSSNLGAMLPPKFPGGHPRRLATLEELCTWELTAVDRTSPEDERLQYQITRELFDAWSRAMHLAAHGTYRVVSATWLGGRKNKSYGSAIRVVVAVQAVIADTPRALAPVDTGALIDLEQLDITEQIEVGNS